MIKFFNIFVYILNVLYPNYNIYENKLLHVIYPSGKFCTSIIQYNMVSDHRFTKTVCLYLVYLRS